MYLLALTTYFPCQSPFPPVEVELGKPWLVQEPSGWCSAGVGGNLLVAPQHELSVYLSEVSFLSRFSIHLKTVRHCLPLLIGVHCRRLKTLASHHDNHMKKMKNMQLENFYLRKEKKCKENKRKNMKGKEYSTDKKQSREQEKGMPLHR